VRSSPDSRRALVRSGAGNVPLDGRVGAWVEADRGDSAAPQSEQKFWPGAVT